MPDYKNTIDGLKKVWNAFDHMEHELYADYVYDALDLINRQSEEIKQLTKSIQHEDRCRSCALFKNQTMKNAERLEDEKMRVLGIVWDVVQGAKSIDKVEDKEWVYEQIRRRVEDGR